jgi:hypothetical protein
VRRCWLFVQCPIGTFYGFFISTGEQMRHS